MSAPSVFDVVFESADEICEELDQIRLNSEPALSRFNDHAFSDRRVQFSLNSIQEEVKESVNYDSAKQKNDEKMEEEATDRSEKSAANRIVNSSKIMHRQSTYQANMQAHIQLEEVAPKK